MKKLLSVLSSTLQGGVRGGLLFVALLATTALWAQRFQVGDLYYNITSSSAPYTVEVSNAVSSITTAVIPLTVTYNGTIYSVTNIGDMAFYNCSSLASITIPNSVTSIGDDAFSGCESLTSVTIPNSVTSIGDYAFYGCSSLTSVTIPNSVKSIGVLAFYNCSSLTSVTIGESVTSIGSYAFRYCSSLTSVTIGESVTSIGDDAFEGCSSLTSVTINSNTIVSKDYSSGDNISHIFGSQVTEYIIGDDVKGIGDRAFYNCSSLTSVTIPNSVTSIGDYAFNNCTSLTSVIIPESVTSIGDYAFYHCSSLTSINIPNSVTSIGSYSFYYCKSLTSITIPNSVTSIGDWAFSRCSSISSVTIPESVTSIGEFAFQGCSSLTSITIPESVINIGEKAFQHCQSLTSITVGKGVTSIGESAFAYCSSLASIVVEADNTTYDSRNDCNAIIETVTNTLILGCQNTIIPNSVTNIGNGAFSHCSSLTSITIPNCVTNIGNSAFNGCSSLNEVILGTGLKTIDAYAFDYCTKLYDIYCLAAEPPTGYTSSFTNYNAFIHVPCESQRLYMLDVLFGEFKYIECIESEDVSTNGVVITPSTNDVTITWPAEAGADTYTIVIKKGNEVFCTLTFNADGQLLNIAFAPGRNGNHPAQYAEQTSNGYRFTVTGLEEGAHYTYDIDVRDAANKTIKSYTGEFTTESMTAVENITTNNANIQKILRDGQLLILRDDKTYNTVGQIVE